MPRNRHSQIRDITLEDAKALAEMMNRSEKGWPWSMGGGISWTTKMAKEEIEGSAAIGYYVAETDGKIVGVSEVYKGLWDKESAVVGFLNVEPDYQGKGFGKGLLRRAVDRAMEKGVDRIELYTWGGNLKALPLYKKTGFFWIPETSVHMVNFLPIVLNHGMFGSFFERNPDWYRAQVRDLSPKPDLLERDGIRIYQYRFRSGKDEVRAIADRQGLWITGGANDRLDVWIHPENEVCPEGLPQTMYWEIENRTKSKMSATLIVKSPESIEVTEPPPTSIDMRPRERVKLEGRFRIDPESEEKPEWEEPERIDTDLIIGSEAMRFRTGVGHRGALQFGYDPRYLAVHPGARAKLHVRLRNRTKIPLIGKVSVAPMDDNISATPTMHSFELDPEGYSGFACDVQIDKDAPSACLPIAFSPTLIDGDGHEVQARREILHASCVRPGELLAYAELNGRVLHLNNDSIRVSIDLRLGGQTILRDRLSEEMLLTGLGGDALGPPFYPSEFERRKCEYHIERGDGFLKATLYLKSEIHQGLTLLKEYIVRRGWPTLTLRYGLINDYPRSRSFKLQTRAGANLNRSRIYLPTKYGLISEDVDYDYPSWMEDAPTNPRDYAEGWVAFEGYKDRLITVGVIWPRETEEIRLSYTMIRHIKLSLTVPADGRVTSPPIHYYAGDGTWKTVREIWRKLAGSSVGREKRYLDIQTRRPFSFGLRESLVSPSSGSMDAAIEVSNHRSKEETGTVEIIPPEGWKSRPARFRFRNLKWGTRTRRIVLTPGTIPRPAVYEGSMVLTTEDERREKKFPVFLLGDGKVLTRSVKDQEREVISTSNGTMEYRICPSFGGIVYSLRARGVEFLASSFPEEKPMLSFNPWFGGLSGSVGRSSSKGWQEEFRARKVTDGIWKGVETTCRPRDFAKDLKGIVVRTRYLTANSSNIIRVRQCISNETRASLEVYSGVNLFLAMGEEKDLESVVPDEKDRPYVRPRTDRPKDFDSRRAWAGFRNEKLDCSLVLAGPTSERTSLWANEARGLTMMGCNIRPDLKPGKSSTWTWHLAVCSSDVEEIARHRHIRELGPLTEPLSGEIH